MNRIRKVRKNKYQLSVEDQSLDSKVLLLTSSSYLKLTNFTPAFCNFFAIIQAVDSPTSFVASLTTVAFIPDLTASRAVFPTQKSKDRPTTTTSLIWFLFNILSSLVWFSDVPNPLYDYSVGIKPFLISITFFPSRSNNGESSAPLEY